MDVLGSAHGLLAKHASDFCLGVLAGSDVQSKIKASSSARPPSVHVRRSPLDPVLVFWLVLAMGLFRSLSIRNVFVHLMGAWRRVVRGALRLLSPSHPRSRLMHPLGSMALAPSSHVQ
jgi:hypothetical protein